MHDQVLATGKPAKVEVKVGEGGEPFSGELPQISVSEPKLEGDPYSGVLAGGDVENQSGEDLERLLLYAVATKGERGRRRRPRRDRTAQGEAEADPLQHLLHRRPRAAPRWRSPSSRSLPGLRARD